jgi:hypothetical protein
MIKLYPSRFALLRIKRNAENNVPEIISVSIDQKEWNGNKIHHSFLWWGIECTRADQVLTVGDMRKGISFMPQITRIIP